MNRVVTIIPRHFSRQKRTTSCHRDIYANHWNARFVSIHFKSVNLLLVIDGPVWLGKLNNDKFIGKLQEILDDENNGLPLITKRKINGVLHGILLESPLALTPLAFNFDLACKKVHSTGLSRKNLLNAIKSLGSEHRLTPSYLSPGHYKTSLPMRAIYDIIKKWKLQ